MGDVHFFYTVYGLHIQRIYLAVVVHNSQKYIKNEMILNNLNSHAVTLSQRWS